MAFDNPAWNFGRVKVGTSLRHEFRFRNVGDEPLRITGVRTTCGCAHTGDYDPLVAPGKSGKLPITVNTRGLSGELARYVLVTTNDPRRREVRLTIEGEVWTDISIQPPAADFGTLTDDIPPPPRLLTIVNNLDTPLELTRVSCSNERYRAELKTLEKGKRFQLTVTAVPPFRKGMNGGYVRVETNLPATPMLMITARAYRSPPVMVSPQVILLRQPSTAPQRKYILVRHAKRQLLDIRNLAVSGDQLQIALDDSPQWKRLKMQRIIVTIPAGYVPPEAGDRVTFKTDEPATPEVTVRVLGSASLRNGARQSAVASALSTGANATSLAGRRTSPATASRSRSPSGSSVDQEANNPAVQAMARYISRFDQDGDGALDLAEWSKLPRDYSYADLDQNGRITAVEFVRAMRRH